MYPYLLAFFFRIGLGLRGIAAIQFLTGVFTLALIFIVARRLLSFPASLGAILLGLLYGPFYLDESQFLRVAWITLTGMLSLFLCLWARQRNSDFWWLLIGVNLGLFYLLQESALLWLGLVALWMGIEYHAFRFLWRKYLLLSAGFGVCLLPLMVRNHLVGVPLLSSSSVGPVTFTFGNSSDVSGIRFEISRFTREILIKSGGRLYPVMINTLKTHPDILSYLRLLLNKFFAFWQGYETPNNTDYYYAELHSSFLKWGTFGFSVIGPLSLLGIFLSLKKRRLFLLLYFYLTGVLIPVILFYHLSRFRLPAVPVLLVFSGLAVEAIVLEFRKQGKIRGLVYILIVLLMYIVLSPPSLNPPGKISANDFITVASFYALKGDYTVALQELDTALRVYPAEKGKIEKIRSEILQMEKGP